MYFVQLRIAPQNPKTPQNKKSNLLLDTLMFCMLEHGLNVKLFIVELEVVLPVVFFELLLVIVIESESTLVASLVFGVFEHTHHVVQVVLLVDCSYFLRINSLLSNLV